MTNLFILYLAAIVIPIYFSSWRLAVTGLGIQGLLLSLILLTGHGLGSVASVVEFHCLLLIRAVFIPWYLFRETARNSQSIAFTLVGTTLGHRLLVLLLVGIGMLSGYLMDRQNPYEAIQIGTALSCFLLGMLMIANQQNPMAQLIGLFTFEGGVTLVELLSPHAMPFAIQVSVSCIDVIFVLTCGQYMPHFQSLAWESAPIPEEVMK